MTYRDMILRIPRSAAVRLSSVTPAWLLLAAAVLFSDGRQAAAEDLLIKARKVYTMTGPPLEPGVVLVSSGKISQVGPTLDVPPEVKVIDLGDGVLMPGLVDACSAADVVIGSSERTREVTPNFHVLSAIHWNARAFREARDEGVTCLNVVPGTSNVIAGLSCAVKTIGSRDARVVNAETGLVLTMASDPSEGNRSRTRPDSIYVRQPTNRMGVVWVLRSALDDVRRGGSGLPRTQDNGPPSPAEQSGASNRNDQKELSSEARAAQSAMVRALRGDLRVFTVARTHYDMLTLLNICDEFNFTTTVMGGQEAYKIADQLAKRKLPLILAPLTTGAWTGADGTELFWNQAAKLHEAGVTFAFSGGRLLEQAQFAARFGLAPEVALQAITSTPSRLIGVEQRVGALAPGRDADLLALTGEPLEFTTAVRWVMVDGQMHDPDANSHGE